MQLYEHLIFFKKIWEHVFKLLLVSKKSLKNFLSVSSEPKPQEKNNEKIQGGEYCLFSEQLIERKFMKILKWVHLGTSHQFWEVETERRQKIKSSSLFQTFLKHPTARQP